MDLEQLQITDSLYIGYNPEMLHIDGLSGLERIGGGLRIISNDSYGNYPDSNLQQVDGLNDRPSEISNNDYLENLDGLNGIEESWKCFQTIQKPFPSPY